MPRTLNRFDLVDAVQRMRSAKNELVKVAIVFDMDPTFKDAVQDLKEEVACLSVLINETDEKIAAYDFPQSRTLTPSTTHKDL